MEKPLNQFHIQRGNYIRNRRKEADIKQAKLAEDAGVSYRYISKLENGWKDARHSTVSKICRALDIDMGDLQKALEPYEKYLND